MKREGAYITAEGLFQLCVRYLEAAGWSRDDDDTGIWLFANCDPCGFGEAMEIQLEVDAVSMLEPGGVSS